MKYLVLLCDGMADYKIDALGGRTPMEAAKKPMTDRLAKTALCGTVSNVPEGMVPERHRQHRRTLLRPEDLL